MSETKKVKKSLFENLRCEEIGEILQFISYPSDIFSLIGTNKRFHQFFCSEEFYRVSCESVYSKCPHIIFKVRSSGKIVRNYFTHISLNWKDAEVISECKRLEHLDIGITDVITNNVELPETVESLKLFQFRNDFGTSVLIENRINIHDTNLTKLDFTGSFTNVSRLDFKLPKNLKELNFSNANISDYLLHSIPETIEILKMGRVRIDSPHIETLFDILNTLKKLKHLELTGYQFDADQIKYLSDKLPKCLTTLDLSMNNIGPDGIKHLSDKLPKCLTTLNLNSNNIGPAGIKYLSDKLPKCLTTLNLRNNNIDDNVAKYLIDKLPEGLKYLDLGFNDLKYFGDKWPRGLITLELSNNNIRLDKENNIKLLSKLRSLNLSDNRIGNDGVKYLILPEGLKTLDLSGNHIEDNGVKDLILPEGLKTLDLNYNHISYKIMSLKLPESLTELNIRYTHIYTLDHFILPQGLLYLDLNGNNIGLSKLDDFKLPESLITLNLSHNSIGDGFVYYLKLPQSLTTLDLSHNSIGDDGANDLKIPESLRHLDLSFNNLFWPATILKLPLGLKSLNLRYNDFYIRTKETLLREKFPYVKFTF